MKRLEDRIASICCDGYNYRAIGAVLEAYRLEMYKLCDEILEQYGY